MGRLLRGNAYSFFEASNLLFHLSIKFFFFSEFVLNKWKRWKKVIKISTSKILFQWINIALTFQAYHQDLWFIIFSKNSCICSGNLNERHISQFKVASNFITWFFRINETYLAWVCIVMLSEAFSKINLNLW